MSSESRDESLNVVEKRVLYIYINIYIYIYIYIYIKHQIVITNHAN